jgi:hypothetical protein
MDFREVLEKVRCTEASFSHQIRKSGTGYAKPKICTRYIPILGLSSR